MITSTNENTSTMLAAMRRQLEEAATIAKVAEACATDGQPDGRSPSRWTSSSSPWRQTSCCRAWRSSGGSCATSSSSSKP